MTLDLTKDVPRSPFDELEGYAWLPRMIDKARAFYAGTHGEYSPYPCPGDKKFLGHFKLDADALGAVIRGGASDAAIAEWVKAHAQGDQASFRAALGQAPGNLLLKLVIVIFRGRARRAAQASRPGVDWSSLDTFAKIIAAEEGHPLPGR